MPMMPNLASPQLGEEGEEHRREEGHDPSGGGVEPEHLTLVTDRRHPDQEAARGRLGRADELAQRQPEDPERALPGQEHQNDPAGDQADERDQDDPLGAEAIVEHPGGDRPDGGDHVGGHAEDQHVCLGQPVHTDGDDRADCEDCGETIADSALESRKYTALRSVRQSVRRSAMSSR